MKSKLNWKPIRNGRFYCAPACGGRCTWAAFLMAKRKARALRKELGAGWRLRVHEDLGWHWEVIDATGCLSVGPCGDEYMAFLGEGTPRTPGGRWVGHGKTARKAIVDAIRQAKRELGGLKQLVSLVDVFPVGRAA